MKHPIVCLLVVCVTLSVVFDDVSGLWFRKRVRGWWKEQVRRLRWNRPRAIKRGTEQTFPCDEQCFFGGMRNQEGVALSDAVAVFQAMDTNKDGTITQDEANAYNVKDGVDVSDTAKAAPTERKLQEPDLEDELNGLLDQDITNENK